MRKRFIAWVGTAVGLGLLAWVFVRLAQEQKMEALRETFLAAGQSPGWLVVAVAVFAVSLACGAARWMVLLRALSIPMRPWRAIQLYVVGHFFNAVVPGATGGDVVKAAYAAGDHAEQRPEAIASIVTERVIGFMALAAVVICVIVGCPSLFVRTEMVRVAGIGFSVAVLLCGVAVFGVNWGKWLEGRTDIPVCGNGLLDTDRNVCVTLPRWVLAVARWHRAVYQCVRSPWTFWSVFAISLVNHVVTALCAGIFALALGLEAHIVDVMCVMVMATAVSAIAMTPGGVGVREMSAIVLLENIGIAEEKAVAVSLLMYAVILVWALVGGVLWMGMLWKPKK